MALFPGSDGSQISGFVRLSGKRPSSDSDFCYAYSAWHGVLQVVWLFGIDSTKAVRAELLLWNGMIRLPKRPPKNFHILRLRRPPREYTEHP